MKRVIIRYFFMGDERSQDVINRFFNPSVVEDPDQTELEDFLVIQYIMQL